MKAVEERQRKACTFIDDEIDFSLKSNLKRKR
jgi:hypothetical protein